MQDDRSKLLAPLLVFAAAIRVAVNNVAVYSRADETAYLLYAKAGYPGAVRLFLNDPGMWVFPNPARWSYIGAASLFCSAAGHCTHRTLATLSTVAGIAAVALTYWIARELFSVDVALIATALVATSPLQLALGRRALADEFFCTMFLASIASLHLYLQRRERLWLLGWIALATLTFAAKEQFLFIYPLVLAFWYARERRIQLVAWIAPPVLFVAIFAVLARSFDALFRLAPIVVRQIVAPYSAQYQSGPPQRLLIDFMALAPIVTVVAIVALGAAASRSGAYRQIALLAFGIVAVHALIPSKNVRYAITADPLLRILVAAFAPTRRVTVAVMLINAAVELAIFRTVFLVGDVYDPLTDNLLRALRMLPR